MTSEAVSEVYWYSGLQVLFVTVFQTSCRPLVQKNHTKAVLCSDISFMDHTVGCCNISFSCLSQIRREKICFAMFLYFCCTFLRDCSCLDATFGQLSPCDPQFFVLAQLFILVACWKMNFFRMFIGNYWEMNREREMFRLTRFPVIKAKSCFLHCSAL